MTEFEKKVVCLLERISVFVALIAGILAGAAIGQIFR